ncbi:hypothetical protein DUI87_26406 [Hirundo rustica rustica]|uniref:ribonuclease H n=1 Tax=Hirundo rustica rustica TaxID=333673 RepID=A0A3M0J8C4_HIRRU|nr:hypothetical protein DUI87_26406 [Hirundo rustica rustica]
MATTLEADPLALPKGVFLICGDRAWAGIPPHLIGGPCTFGLLCLFTPNKTTIMDWRNKNSSTQLVIQKRDLASPNPNCDSEIIHWSKPKGVAITVFLPWVSLAKALGELVHLECWVTKQANLTSNALANLLSDEEITRQAALQNRAAINYLLLLHGHRCEEFEGLCCFSLSSQAENVHKAIQQMRELVDKIKRETNDWLSGLFKDWGLLVWAGSILKTILLALFVLIIDLISFGIIKRMVIKLISSTTHSPSVNRVIIPTAPELEEGLQLEEGIEGKKTWKWRRIVPQHFDGFWSVCGISVGITKLMIQVLITMVSSNIKNYITTFLKKPVISPAVLKKLGKSLDDFAFSINIHEFYFGFPPIPLDCGGRVGLENPSAVGLLRVEEQQVPIATSIVHRRQYRTTRDAVIPIHKMIRELESQGVVSKTHSPFNSPIWPVRKSDGEWRLTVDYRALNEVTPPLSAAVPDMLELQYELESKAAKWYATIDIANAFFSIPLAAECRPQFAFTWRGVQYTWNRLPQGVETQPHHLPWTDSGCTGKG